MNPRKRRWIKMKNKEAREAIAEAPQPVVEPEPAPVKKKIKKILPKKKKTPLTTKSSS